MDLGSDPRCPGAKSPHPQQTPASLAPGARTPASPALDDKMDSHSKGHDGDGLAKNSKYSETPKNRKRMDTSPNKDEAAVALKTPLTDTAPPTPSPRAFDLRPCAMLQVPEGACSRTKYAILTIMEDLRSLQAVGSAEPLDRQAFLEKITVTLDAWEHFFSPYFTEEIKQLVAGLKVVKQAIDKDAEHRRQATTELAERAEQADQLVEKADKRSRMSLSERLERCRVQLKIRSLREELQSELEVWMVNDSIMNADLFT